MPADFPRPAAVILGVPTFTPAELHKQLDAVLGKGASGTVYSLRDYPGLAVKEIQLDGLDQRSIDAARLELATLPALSHPGILRYHQVIEDDSFIYIVMDRHDGTLECLLIEHKRKKTHVSNRLICSIARQIAGALTYLSSASGVDARRTPFRGLVHRDLKPDNVLVSEDGSRVVLADFGLCKDALRSGSTFAGSPAYMAPETLVYNSTSPASDIWALGVIIYELAALKRPNFLEGREPKDVFINGWKPDLSPVKDDFIRSILERIFVLDPAKRPTARELAELFQAHRTSSEGDSPHTTAWEAVLKDANARIAALERELHTNSSDICSLRNTITTQTAEIDSLRKELKTKSAKIDALEQQFTRAIEALEEKTHRRETEMDQQLAQDRAEADQHKKELEALKLANEHADKHDEETSRVEEALTLEAVDDRGVTALMKAAMRNDVEAVKALVTKQKKLRDSNGRTALMHAAEMGHTEIVATLAPHEKGLADSSSNTALMLAASNAHIEAVRVLIEHEKGMSDNQEHNALYYALKNGHMEVVGVLIEADDPTDENGVTALMRAAARGDAEMVELLIPIQKGMMDKDGNTAFIHALGNKHADTATVLREHEAPSWTPLMCAAAAGDIETAEQHLSDKDKKNNDGDTALTLAARAGHEDIVELLDPTDRDGVTALMRAVDRNDVEAVRALIPLQRGRRAPGAVKINGRYICKGTALMRAAAHGYAEIVELLLEHEGGIQDKAGETALMHAAWSGHAECVKLLLEKEGGIQRSDGLTALMWATCSNKPECTKLLAEREKDMKTTRVWNGFPPGTTALDIAKRMGYKEIASILSE